MHRPSRSSGGAGFSLLELVIVVAILSIIGAIAVPRMSRGAGGAAEAALKGNLAVLRSAIDLYRSEHGGAFPSPDRVNDQLTKYTDDLGNTANVKGGAFEHQPCLRKVPPMPVGARRGSVLIGVADAAGVGWIYVQATGEIRANTSATEQDASGKLYSNY